MGLGDPAGVSQNPESWSEEYPRPLTSGVFAQARGAPAAWPLPACSLASACPEPARSLPGCSTSRPGRGASTPSTRSVILTNSSCHPHFTFGFHGSWRLLQMEVHIKEATCLPRSAQLPPCTLGSRSSYPACTPKPSRAQGTEVPGPCALLIQTEVRFPTA